MVEAGSARGEDGGGVHLPGGGQKRLRVDVKKYLVVTLHYVWHGGVMVETGSAGGEDGGGIEEADALLVLPLLRHLLLQLHQLL